MPDMMENNKKRFLSLLGIARKANALTIGSASTVEAIRSPGAKNKLSLVIIASDAAKNTKKRLTDSSNYYGIRYTQIGADSNELGHATGKYGSAACVGVADEGFAAALLKIAETQETEAD